MKTRPTLLVLACAATVASFIACSMLAQRIAGSQYGALLRERVGANAATLEDAEQNVKQSRRLASEMLGKAVDKVKDVEKDAAAGDKHDLEVAFKRFDGQMVKIENMRSLYDRDVSDLRRLGTAHFQQWREKVAEIRDSSLRLDQEYTFATNRNKFDQELARAEEELARLVSAIDKGKDLQRVAECLRLARQADKATRSLETLASEAAETARVFLDETTTLMNMLASE
jgi:hypothetical protein